MPIRRVPLAIAGMFVFFFTSCGETPENDPQGRTKKLQIEYFWSAANNAYGYASVKAGVRAALEAEEKDASDNSGEFKLSDYVQFEGREDANSQEKAEESAREIRANPNVLAVIGHAASGTTFAAVPRYAEAGIPVLITSATSPYLLYSHSSGARVPSINVAESDHSTPRFHNVFRLIPSDIPDQAHTMVLTIKARWKKLTEGKPGKEEKPKVLLICDATKDSGAEIYSKPLCDYLAAPLNRKEGHYDVADRIPLDNLQVSTILPEIHVTMPDFIVVASYVALARLVLQIWSEDMVIHPNNREPPPEFIMPDACLSPELLKFDAKISVTYPMNPSHIEECDSRNQYIEAICEQKMEQLHLADRDVECDEGELHWKSKQNNLDLPRFPETDEMFAYDSVLILSDAIKQCVAQQSLNRSCVLMYLNEHHDALRGTCEVYHVEHGDRQNAYYYVYANSGTKSRHWSVRGFAKNDDYELYPEPNLKP